MVKEQTLEKLQNLQRDISIIPFEDLHYEILTILYSHSERLVERYREIIEIVTEDEVNTHIKLSINTISLRIFLNNTNEAAIYKINGYGNLENIIEEDLKIAIEELIKEIKGEY